jgi:hypothetical protein
MRDAPRMSFAAFRARHPAFVIALAIISLTTIGVDAWLMNRRTRYELEIQRLRAGMSDFERRRSDAILASQERQLEMMMVLVRRQAKWDKEIHLAITVDSGRMYLEQQGALLRQFPIEVGPERRVGQPPDTVHLAIPRGTRVVQSVLADSNAWDVPPWVYGDRGLAIPAGRSVRGALGPVAILLEGGTVIYSLPEKGPLADPAYVLPGAIRARAEDLQAVVPNVTRGTAVYFY